MGEILGALKGTSERARSYSPLVEREPLPMFESEGEWAEDLTHEEEDSNGEDSVSEADIF